MSYFKNYFAHCPKNRNTKSKIVLNLPYRRSGIDHIVATISRLFLSVTGIVMSMQAKTFLIRFFLWGKFSITATCDLELSTEIVMQSGFYFTMRNSVGPWEQQINKESCNCWGRAIKSSCCPLLVQYINQNNNGCNILYFQNNMV